MLIKRDIQGKIERYMASPEAIVVTGMRRVGKTTLLRMLFNNVPTENKIFLDLENPLHQKYFSHENYDAIMDELADLGMNVKEKVYVFLDEIQAAPSIPSVVKYLIDHYNVKFVLSGSASYYIKNLFTESLSGRKYIFELFPFSFREFLRCKNVHGSQSEQKNISEGAHLRMQRYFNEYMIYGGFPGVVIEDAREKKIQKIEDIFSSYWSLEVERLSGFRKKDRVRDLIFLLMQRTGSRLDIAKIAREIGVAQETVNDYILFLRDTYLISLISPFSTNIDVEIRAAKKVYCIDSGILNHFSRVSEGSLFENVCFSLLRTTGTLQYYQKKNGQEIDFILDGKKAYEVKNTAQLQDVRVLKRRAKSISMKEWSVVSKNYSKADKNVTYGFQL